eukprot:COSAG06_NODE_1320_length_9872_cov_49.877213_14_plen_77_part_00
MKRKRRLFQSNHIEGLNDKKTAMIYHDRLGTNVIPRISNKKNGWNVLSHAGFIYGLPFYANQGAQTYTDMHRHADR